MILSKIGSKFVDRLIVVRERKFVNVGERLKVPLEQDLEQWAELESSSEAKVKTTYELNVADNQSPTTS